MRKIVRRQAIVDDALLPEALHPVLRQVFRARPIQAPHELEPSLQHLLPTDGLRGLEQAVDLLQGALTENQRVLIVGDFDADGATSTAVCIRALAAMGARQVDYLVPNRFDFGYGLTPELVEEAAKMKPDLIITVDNGIASHGGVSAARAHGIRVLVTDHHLPGPTLPEADAIVNPNQPDDAFACKAAAGVGVIFYVMLALRGRLREAGWFERTGGPEPNLATLLDLVALGTVADVVPLDFNNRILVEQGLRRIRAGKAVPGIAALLEAAGRDPARVVASDLGFAVGPRLNAAGRLEDMSLGIECLLTDDADAAREIAIRLDGLNRERREIESRMQEDALAELGDPAALVGNGEQPFGICLFDDQWHQGVIGILASRIKERFHRPVIAFAPANDEEIKGSARAVPGLHIRDVLAAIDAQHPGLLGKFGGHAMAAGMSLKRADFDRFREAFDAEVRKELSEDDLVGVIYSDGELAAEQFDIRLARELRQAAPWGQGFPEPIFDGVFNVISKRIVGERHVKFTLRHPEGSQDIDGIAFGAVDRGWHEPPPQVRLAYKLDANLFRGRETVQLMIEELQAVEP